MNKKIVTISLAVSLLALGAGSAKSETLTTFFRTSDLTKIAHTGQVRDLAAQNLSKTGSQDVNSFDDFYLINGAGQLVVNFDHSLNVKGQVKIPMWLGPGQMSNKEISADIQAGWLIVKKAFGLSGPVANVAVYRTLNTSQIVYCYTALPADANNMCMQYLYTPATKKTELGMKAGCYWDLKNFESSGMGSAGKAGAAEK